MQLDKAVSYPSISISDLMGRQLNDVESKNAPKSVFYSGLMKTSPSHVRISIVGSRQASDKGLVEAADLSKFLTKNDVVVVSGLARGIDTAVHQAAMSYDKGTTIAVLGTPLNRSYPRENRTLQEKIMRDHLAISQYPIGHKTTRKDFVLRNKTMALISDVTIIVEAGESSGALHQGWETLRIGRPLFICRSVFENDRLNWPEKMLQYGARILEKYDDLMESISIKAYAPELLRYMK